METRLKWFEQVVGDEVVERVAEVVGLLVSFFVWKNERKELHLLTVKDLGVLSLALRRLFIVEKRALGLVEPEYMRSK